MVGVAIPLSIERTRAAPSSAPTSTIEWLAVAAGVAAFAGGVTLFAASVANFWRRGRGTLAPWDPPRSLVISGPYRYVRNPMISGVVLILIAESLVLRSVAHGEWALFVTVINLVYIPLLEEPVLEQRFGDEYREYALHVGRLIPRLRPWPPAGPEHVR